MSDLLENTETGQGPRIRARAWIAGFVAGAATIAIVTYTELVTQTIMIGFLQLPPVVVTLLFLFVIANKIVAWLLPGRELRTAELLIVHTMMLMASMIASRGLLERINPTLMGVNYFASTQNRWEDTFFPNIKPWMVPWNPKGGAVQDVSKWFYEGLKEGDTLPWGLWIGPLLVWGGLYALVYGAFLCMASLIYRQWSQNERLSFPLVQLPLEMIRTGEKERSFWRSSPMWIGFGLMVFYFGVRGLHAIRPEVPNLPGEFNMRSIFNSPPWNGSDGWFMCLFSFAAMGFFYLLPTSVSLSLWLFYLLGQVQLIVLTYFGTGWPDRTELVDSETIGSYIVLVIGWVWIGRRHLKDVLLSLIGRREVDDSQELLPYPVAFVGLWVCFFGMSAFGMLMGMSWWVALLMFGIYLFCESIVMARSTAEAGMIMTEGSFRPIDVYALFSPRQTLGAPSLTATTFFDALFSRDLRGMVFTGFLDVQRMSEDVGVRRRKLVAVLVAIIVFAFAAGTVLHLKVTYKYGGTNLYSYVFNGNNVWHFREHGKVLARGEPYKSGNLKAAAVGAGVTIALLWIRQRVYWWPLHPLGYALSRSWTAMVFWFPALMAWLIKTNVVKYGGNKLYKSTRPFFLGLIFGEFFMGAFWGVVCSIFDLPASSFPWP